MAIAPSQIEYRLSVPDATSGDSADGAAGLSLGGWVSRSVVHGGVIGAVFPSATPVEFSQNAVDYQCVFVVNRHPRYPLSNAVAWLTFQKPGGQTIDIAPDDNPASSINAAEEQAVKVPDKGTAPSLASPFSLAPSKALGIQLGTIGPNQAKPIWLRRSGTFDGAAVASADPPAPNPESGPNNATFAGYGSLVVGRPAVAVLNGTGVLKLSGAPNFTSVALSGEGVLVANAGQLAPLFFGYGSLTLLAKAALAYVAAPTPDSVILRVEGYSPA
jgi:hypothetical protein